MLSFLKKLYFNDIRILRFYTLTAGLVVFLTVRPGNLSLLPDVCLWKRIFGYCPACGSTHALCSFFHGDILKSLEYNINIIITAPLYLFLFIRELIYIIKLYILKRNISKLHLDA